MRLKKIYVDAQYCQSSLVKAILERSAHIPNEVIDGPLPLVKRIRAAGDPVLAAKQVLFLTGNRGAFVRKCPGTKEYTCCDYKILHIGTFCTMDCSYCILQSYFHPPLLQLFVNTDRMATQLDDELRLPGIHRIGTGEYTDSMIWEWWTDLSTRLVSRFSRQSRGVLELKTKTTAIGNLKALEHNRKTIVAWSVNTDAVIAGEERFTRSLESRLEAAARCERWGYPLAFHFDPIILYPGCREAYLSVVDRIFDSVAADNIVWISLGTFRFMPDLKQWIQKRFPRSKIVYGEFIQGLDKKQRYFKPLRIDIYKAIVDRIRAHAPETLVYFCMEDTVVWQRVMGFKPEERGGLGHMLDESAVRVCRLDPTALNGSATGKMAVEAGDQFGKAGLDGFS